MKIELATEGIVNVGYRLTVGSESYLIFADQKAMPGLRVGEKFTPSFGSTITYQEAAEVWKDIVEKSRGHMNINGEKFISVSEADLIRMGACLGL